MKENLLIYGCYGYTGNLITKLAVEKGLKVIVAGRDAAKTEAVAKEFAVPFAVFDLADEKSVANNLANVKVVLHCAGPFKYTALPMAKACLATQTHYLDITGEIEVFEAMQRLDIAAKEKNVLLMPGVGFDVVPSDCMSLFLKEQMPDATNLELAIMTVGGTLSHGTSITVVENLGGGSARRENGKIIATKSGYNTKEFDFKFTKKIGVEIPWGDVSTAFFTTKIPNITVFNILPKSLVKNMRLSNYLGFILKQRFVKDFLIKKIKQKPAGPDAQMREKAKLYILGTVTNGNKEVRALLSMPEGYWLTAMTAVQIATECMKDSFAKNGYQTPAAVFGADFILQFTDVKREVLA